MSKIKDFVAMDGSLGDVKVRTKEMDYERIVEPVDELCKDLCSFL